MPLEKKILLVVSGISRCWQLNGRTGQAKGARHKATGLVPLALSLSSLLKPQE
jgi:hypothetical protein